MILLTDYNKPYMIDSINGTIVPTHFWTFNGKVLDFMLAPILYIEETTGDVIELMINGTILTVPASWHILVTDEEMCTLDTVPIHQCSKNDFKAVLMGTNDSTLRNADIQILDVHKRKPEFCPMIPRGSLICHAVGPQANRPDNMQGIMIGSSDLTKYLSGHTIGDLYY